MQHITPPCIKRIMAQLEDCLDDELAVRQLRNGRGWTAEERAAWKWIDDAIMTPYYRHAFVELDEESRKYLDHLLQQFAAVVHPDEQSQEEELSLFDAVA